jgi:hypothetical protein
MNKIKGNKEMFLSILFYLGYFTLVGPPRAISMKKKLEKKATGELFGEPIWVVLIVELAMRGSMFILLAVGLELLLGNDVFETVYGDEILVGLMFCGLLHVLSYYIGLLIIAQNNKNLGIMFYRLGRNLAYAIFVGILSVTCILFYQYVNQIKIIKGDIAIIFENIFFIFVLIGVIEAILKVNKKASTIDL